MRLASLLCLLLVLTGISAAQDTNFSVGPQYLITSDSPMFLHSIATPTLSLSAPTPSVSAAATEAPAESSSASASASAAPPFQPDLTRIYWRGPAVNESIDNSAGESVSQNVSQNPSEIEITSAPLPIALPASILDTGVTGMTDAQSLRQRGYGVSVGETAAFWKTHKPHASRHYTNADVQRLRQS
jgi:hypothetical protein